MNDQDFQLDDFLDSEELDPSQHVAPAPPLEFPALDEEYFEKQRLACGLPPSVPYTDQPSCSGAGPQSVSKDLPTNTKSNLASVTPRKRATKAKVSEATQPKRPTAYLAVRPNLLPIPPTLPPAPTPPPAPHHPIPAEHLIQGPNRSRVLQLLVSGVAALGKPKKFYELPEGEYLIHHIGEKRTHATFGQYQVVLAESRADGVRNYVLVTKPFTSLSEELRGTYVPPLIIYSKHIQGQKFTDLKFLG
jgi:hypothetical protein